MTKREIVIGVSGFLVAGLLAGSGYFIFNGSDEKKSVSKAEQTVGDHIIPLGQKTTETKTGGLSVSSSSGAQSLGQLGGQSGQQSGGSSSSSGGIDPSKFKEYEKYKDSPSALFAEVKAGTGAELKSGTKAAAVYKGWLTDGTMFDQSRTGTDGKIQAFSFTMGAGQVIPGWEQAMAGMKVGGTRLLIVPPAVGYGSQGQGSIPPNSVLVFLVQLVDAQ